MAGARRSNDHNSRSACFAWIAPAAAMLVFSVTGCALTRPSNPAASPASADSARARQLSAALAERSREFTSVQADAVMEFREADQHVKAREQIMARRPADLRVEAMSPFGLALVVAVNDSNLQIFDPSSNTLYRGEASAASLNRFARIPLAPRPAVNLLMGLAPEGESFDRAPDSVSAEGAILIAAYNGANGSVTELGFESAQLALVRERLKGAIDYEVRYSDYRDIGGVQFAHRIEADFPASHTHVNFTFQHAIINGAIADSLFALKPGPETKHVDLDHAQISSAVAPAHG